MKNNQFKELKTLLLWFLCFSNAVRFIIMYEEVPKGLYLFGKIGFVFLSMFIGYFVYKGSGDDKNV